MLPPPPLHMNESWRLHLGPPPARPVPRLHRPPLPVLPVSAVVAREHHVFDWRLRLTAGVALLLAIVALGGVG